MLGPVLETLIAGLLTGVLYSLVALGFVLIFKASGVFNFAQGAMVLFAALSLARLSEFMPLALAFVLSVLIMIALAYAIEFLVLRRRAADRSLRAHRRDHLRGDGAPARGFLPGYPRRTRFARGGR
jgi:branched-subunit amino acid ABC-type transport system permease component